jgi:hypothetical protein
MARIRRAAKVKLIIIELLSIIEWQPQLTYLSRLTGVSFLVSVELKGTGVPRKFYNMHISGPKANQMRKAISYWLSLAGKMLALNTSDMMTGLTSPG